MKFKKNVTFIGYSQYTKKFQNIDNWTELSFMEHDAFNYKGNKAVSYTLSDDKFKRILDYAHLPGLELSQRYEIWVQDYHDNRKFNISSIKKI